MPQFKQGGAVYADVGKDLPHAEMETGTRCAVTLNRNMEARQGLSESLTFGKCFWRRGRRIHLEL